MLKLLPSEPQWIELLPGVRVQFAPITIKSVRAARRHVAAALNHDAEDIEEAGDAFSREMIRRGIIGWEGVGDAQGEPIAVTPEAIELFLADSRAYEAAEQHYVGPWIERDLEGNGLSPLPAGTGAAGTKASGTARSAAKPKRPGRAASALTKRPSSAKPRKSSGTSSTGADRNSASAASADPSPSTSAQ